MRVKRPVLDLPQRGLISASSPVLETMEREMGAVEITLVSFIAVMAGIAGSCILSFVFKKPGVSGTDSVVKSLSSSRRE